MLSGRDNCKVKVNHHENVGGMIISSIIAFQTLEVFAMRSELDQLASSNKKYVTLQKQASI